MAGLTFCYNEGYGVDGFPMLVGGDALVDISVLQVQAFDLEWRRCITGHTK